MAFLDRLGLKVIGTEAQNAARAVSKLKLGSGYTKSAMLGAGIGGIVGLARGDNYDSTAALRNFTSGAMGGAGLAVGLRAALPRLPGALSHLSGLSHAAAAESGSRFAAFRNAPLPRIVEASGRIGGSIANKALKVGGFLGRRPGLAAGAAILGGTAVYMSNAGNPSHSLDNAQLDGSNSRNEFAASTQNLVQSLHRGRHR